MKNFPYKPVSYVKDDTEKLHFKNGEVKIIEFYQKRNTAPFQNETICIVRYKKNPFRFWECRNPHIDGYISTRTNRKAHSINASHIGRRRTYIETDGDVHVDKV